MVEKNFSFWWYLFRSVQILWILPATILVWIFYVLPMWIIARDLVFVRWAQFGVAEFILAKNDLEPWFAKAWRDWAGWSGPCVIIWKGDKDTLISTTRFHELRHCAQQFWFGLFFYPVYLGCSIYIWLFCPGKSAYLDNFFEVDARWAAGQQIHIPPRHWERNQGMRWPWW